MSNVFFTSDEHHGHANIIRFCKRPYSGIEEMTEALVENHNKVVKDGDIVYHLGDMFWRTVSPFPALDIMRRLKGNHYYIRGNHEELIDKCLPLRQQFVWVKDRARIFPVGSPSHGIVLDHFAGRVWHRSDKGSWQLYGHSHAALPEHPSLLAFDVGVDACNYTPISMEEVQQRMQVKLDALKLTKTPRG